MASINPNIKFGLKTLVKNSTVLFDVLEDSGINLCKRPIFCHPNFEIETTFNADDDPNGPENSEFGLYNGKYYTKTTSQSTGFRKRVLWNFGDGTEVESITAKHTYTRPGKYRITCIFFDIDRKGHQNQYYIDVIVKEIIPTMISFDKDKSSVSEIKCSKPELIAKIQATLANTVEEDLKVCAKRVFQYKQLAHENTYDEVKEKQFPHLHKYYTFLEKKPNYYIDTLISAEDKLEPTDKYTLDYHVILGEFIVKEQDGKNILDVNLYKFEEFKNMPTQPDLLMLDPWCDISEGETWISKKVNRFYNQKEINEDVVLFGKRAIEEIYYKSDYPSPNTTISLFFDIDEQLYDRDLKKSVNYTNIPPLGLTFKVAKNSKEDVRWCITLNGFIHKSDDISWDEFSNNFFDDYSENALFMNKKIPCVLIPYIPLFSTEDLLLNNSQYYIPKDISFLSEYKSIGERELEENSYIELLKSEISDENYIRYFILNLKDYINIAITLYFGVGEENKKEILIDKELTDLDSVLVPREKTVKQNIDDLLNCYFPHPAFTNAGKMKTFFKSILNYNNVLDNILTRSYHFVDDTINYKTAYISNLLSLLTSMDEDVSSYEIGDFGSVYELRDFTRLLSMNHSDLVGNVYTKNYDFVVNDSYKGENLDKKLKIGDEIYVNKYGEVVRAGNKIYGDTDGRRMLMIDDHNGESKIIDFSTYVIHNIDNIEDDEWPIKLKIGDNYKKYWSWNIQLPAQYNYLIADDSDDLSDKDLEDKNRVIDNHYTFWIIKENDPTELRYLNNFIRDEDLQARKDLKDDFSDFDVWNAEWGVTYKCLMKIIHNALGSDYIKYEESDDNFNTNKQKISLSIRTDNSNAVFDLFNAIKTYISPGVNAQQLISDIKLNAKSLSVDWGDGSSTSIATKNIFISTIEGLNHKYDKPGDYLISINISSDIWGDTISENNTCIAKSSHNYIESMIYIPNSTEAGDDKPLAIYTLVMKTPENK